ncbi:hypothetical protein [Streptomyces sp. SID8499]|uniref:hypothetical protein n=1 Tax=Streptomyces sp. SID8499 TaxID=2706106 RepID=UPI0013C6BA46|nr:hypothetical protein [Streptomyces sp. SID8499]NED31105.1 hypothetical protein [Streptomyces sp. SID8499]
MLTTYVSVPRGADPEPAALTEILWRAQTSRIFLARPLNLKITPATGGLKQLATLMGLTPDEDHDAYRVDSETEPCPPT